MQALCLCKESKNYQRYAHLGCDKKELGIAIDMPGPRVREYPWK